MTKIQELFENVTKDSALQTRFIEIMKDAEKIGEEETNEKLIVFAKDAGYDITPEEIQAFFKDFEDKDESGLSDAELDMVAGGSAITDSLSSYIRKFLGMNCFRSDGIVTS